MLQNYYNKDTKTFIIPYTFNNKLKDIPNETEKIIFEQNLKIFQYSSFNQIIKKGTLPNNLINLTFGLYFNQKMEEGVLPNSLINLTFGKYFNQEIGVAVLPNSLTNITFGEYFIKKIKDGVLPNSLINMTFWTRSKLHYNIPEHIKTINVKFNYNYNKNIDTIDTIDTIPVTIEKIIIDKNKIKFLQKIPYGCMVVDEKDEEIKIYLQKFISNNIKKY